MKMIKKTADISLINEFGDKINISIDISESSSENLLLFLNDRLKQIYSKNMRLISIFFWEEN